MEKEDQYWIVETAYTLRYFKNSKLHREMGPAVIFKNNPNLNDYLELSDAQLYLEKRKPTLTLESIEKSIFGPCTDYPSFIEYYLDGIEYSKQEFYTLKTKKELEQELSNSSLPLKKNKI